MRLLGHVARTGERRGAYRVWVGGGNLKEIDHLEEPGIDERITLRWIFRKSDVGAWTRSIRLRIGTGGGNL